MSDRQYIPGVSAPEVFGRTRKRALASKLGPAITQGVRTPENPLGLFFPADILAAENGEWGLPSPYNSPYAKLSLDDLNIANTRQGIELSDPYTAIGGLVFGGMYAYVLSNRAFDEMEKSEFIDYANARFSSYVTATIQREIARVVLAEYPESSVHDIFRIIRASYLDTIGKLTRCSNDDAVAIEAFIGAVTLEDPEDEIIEAELVLRRTLWSARGGESWVPTHVELRIKDEPDIVNDRPLCGGEYMRHKGSQMPLLLWTRVNRVAKQLPWALEDLKN